ncbi:MAG: ATP-binding protein [Candidatus Omnitrophota bacterium]
MPKRRLQWKLYPSYLLVTVFSLIAVAGYSTISMRAMYLSFLQSELESYARLVKNQIERKNLPLDASWVDPICKEEGALIPPRLTVISSTGEVVGESEENPHDMENHLHRPEIQDALRMGFGKTVRYSNTVEKEMMYIAVSLQKDGETIGVARAALSTSAIAKTTKDIFRQIFIGGIAAIIIGAIVSFAISRHISLPLVKLQEGAARFAKGDLSAKLEIAHSEEIDELAEAMNRMAAQLNDRIRAIVRQRNQQEAILSSMVEGVLAVDGRQRLIGMNQSAAEWLGAASAAMEGQPLDEIVRNKELRIFAAKVLSSPQPIEGEIILDEEEVRFIQLHGSPLCDANGDQIGAVIVLDDVTRLRRLETIRRDFAANVSHELKTPITSIKGFVETLIDGAIDNREDAMRFLGIIARQSDRLQAIIEDLLSLARIEQDEQKENIPLEFLSLLPVIQSSIEFCKMKASEKNIAFNMVCSPEIQAKINPPLLEQALVNLIDNAIKYSEEGGRIKIEALSAKEEILLNVQDWGSGIPQEHLRRIFERFYRVDKARSRKLGGTGLGLAIVKHIALAHRGSVSVESSPGKGSVFTICLPSPNKPHGTKNG